MQNVLAGLTVLILAFIVIRNVFYYINSVSIKSNIDNRYYTVRNTKNAQASADLLALTNKNVMVLIEHLKTIENPSINVKLLIDRYSPDSLMENISLDNTTYTVNKGSEIAVCLATRDTKEQLYDINKIMFVVIHELAHVGCENYGHGKEFVMFFIYLLKKSVELKIYEYHNYQENPQEYCGMTISTTPI